MINICNLTKLYPGTNKGVRHINLHIETGEICALLGNNGAGKTTFLKAIVGIHNYDDGDIYFNGVNFKDSVLDCKRKFAYVPDNPDIYEYLSGTEYLNFIADIYEVDKEKRISLINDYATRFAIGSEIDEMIASYSHGMKQKIVLIGALIHEPKILILDEPFVGLDPKAIYELKQIMHEICKNGGAVLFSTHVLDAAEKLCNKVAIIKDGQLICQGKMAEIIKPGQSLEDIFMEVSTNVKTSPSYN